jgi:Trypsin-like peptidase domain
MKNGFIQIPILITIIASILVLGGVSYVGVKQYRIYQVEKVVNQKLAEENKKTEEDRQLKLQELLDSQSKELKTQKSEINALKNKPSVIINTPNKSNELSRADIIAQWTPDIAYIVCKFSIDDPKTIASLRKYGVSTAPEVLAGSGFVRSITTKNSSAPVVAIITNRHVLNAHNGFSGPSSCEVTLPGNHKYTFGEQDYYFQTNDGESGDIEFIDGQPYVIPITDAGWLWVRNPDSYISDLATKSKLCSVLPRIGDDVVILGYPGIGADTGITATEGIISGVEGKYFVTSAKVEHGNSGGVALYKDQNCYFGIPTFVRTGTVESLARILNYKETFIVGY